jgi:hypothetical protein
MGARIGEIITKKLTQKHRIERPVWSGHIALPEFRYQPDPARPSHRPAIFKNESQEWRTGNLSSAAKAAFYQTQFFRIKTADCSVIFLTRTVRAP